MDVNSWSEVVAESVRAKLSKPANAGSDVKVMLADRDGLVPVLFSIGFMPIEDGFAVMAVAHGREYPIGTCVAPGMVFTPDQKTGGRVTLEAWKGIYNTPDVAKVLEEESLKAAEALMSRLAVHEVTYTPSGCHREGSELIYGANDVPIAETDGVVVHAPGCEYHEPKVPYVEEKMIGVCVCKPAVLEALEGEFMKAAEDLSRKIATTV